MISSTKKYNKGDIINQCELLEISKERRAGLVVGKFKCFCGNLFSTRICRLFKKNVNSCGCLKIKKSKENIIHGKSHTSEYKAYYAMLDRCYNTNIPNYKNYGAKGIKVCDRWKDKENGLYNFLKDMGEKPTKKHSLERKRVKEDYYPDNCRWATTKEQSRNKRNNILIEFNGKIQCLQDWAIELNMKFATLNSRYKLGLSIDKILSTEKFPTGRKPFKKNQF